MLFEIAATVARLLFTRDYRSQSINLQDGRSSSCLNCTEDGRSNLQRTFRSDNGDERAECDDDPRQSQVSPSAVVETQYELA